MRNHIVREMLGRVVFWSSIAVAIVIVATTYLRFAYDIIGGLGLAEGLILAATILIAGLLITLIITPPER